MFLMMFGDENYIKDSPNADIFQGWTGKLFFSRGGAGQGWEGQGQKSMGRGGAGNPPLPTVRGRAGKGS